MDISIFTATGHHNLGDELILLKEYEVFKENYKNANFNIFTYDKESSLIKDKVNYIQYFPTGMFAHPFKNIGYLIKNIIVIMKSDIVIIGGGGLIYENEFQSAHFPIMQWLFRIILSKIFAKRIIYFAVGINIKKPGFFKRFLFSGKKVLISVRDKESSETLNRLGIRNIVINDPVFLLKPEKREKNDGKTIGISLRKGYLKNEEENIKQMILFLSKKGYRIVFLSHSIHQKDALANDYVFLKDISKKYGIEMTSDIRKTLDMYKKLDFVIGMRFHSLILSLVYNIPFLALSYSQKTDELLKEFKYDHKMDPKRFEFEKFIKMFEHIEENESLFDFKENIHIIEKEFKNNISNFLKNGLE
ncbi:MAG: polysaccharide pyruvyl transferase family protein [Candidatus Gracilibacteria bacterium]|nr:polysaccharide pyruvyl transferase family protein [Candidatus Gracilibacteria bacterium]